jgi:hypothetical protein
MFLAHPTRFERVAFAFGGKGSAVTEPAHDVSESTQGHFQSEDQPNENDNQIRRLRRNRAANSSAEAIVRPRTGPHLYVGIRVRPSDSSIVTQANTRRRVILAGDHSATFSAPSEYRMAREPGIVNKRPRLPPLSLGRSISWLADRRRDPTPIDSSTPSVQVALPDPALRRRIWLPSYAADGGAGQSQSAA